MGLLGDREISRTERPSKWVWYACHGTPSRPACTFRTEQLRGLPEVLHRCPVTKTLRAAKEET